MSTLAVRFFGTTQEKLTKQTTKLEIDMENRIKFFRKKKDLSLDQLAELIGVGKSTIHRLEAGETSLYHELLPDLAEKLGATILELTGLDAEAAEPQNSAQSEIDAMPLDCAEMLGFKFGQDIEIWEALTGSLDAIGIEPGDLLTIVPLSEKKITMGDPVILRVRTEGDLTISQQKGGMMRQYIEPNMFITNSIQHDRFPINSASQDVVIIGSIASKVFRPYSRKVAFK